MKSSRRDFLKQTLLSATALSAASGDLLSPRARAAARPHPRRHLINIHGGMRGGWDSFWFHNSFRASDVQPIVAKYPTQCALSLLSTLTPGNQPASRFSLQPDSLQTLPVAFSERFPENSSQGRLVTDSNGTLHWLGTGMTNYTQNDLSQMVIWKGLTKDADHGLSNLILLHGQLSSYALSFSSLIASGLSDQGYLRPLQFVEVMAAPLVNTRMATGVQVPILIPDLATFQSLTAPAQGESANQDLRNMLNDTISKLATTLSTSRFQINAGKALYSSFSSSFNSFLSLGGSNLGQSIELQGLIKWYAVKIAQEAHGLLNPATGTEYALRAAAQGSASYASDLAAALGKITDNTSQIAAYLAKKNALLQANPLLTSTQLEALPDLASLAAAFNGTLGDINSAATSNPTFTNLLSWSFRFAFADFLIRNELSAVVDLMIPVSDAHTNGADQLMELAFDFSAFRILMQSLRSYALPDGSGRSLLDVSGLVMTTDFDRTPYLYAQNPALDNVAPGTNHGNSVSVILAGGLVQGGRVVGDVRSGRQSEDQYGSYLSGVNAYSYPLPIDPKTGITTPGGTRVTSGSLFLTMLAIYGVTPPLQLQTAAGIIPAVIKS